jgi:hypothetical protein
MFCPLCKAEYREGFERCSDCKINLVSTYEEAQAVKVVQLWEGASVSKLNAIVGFLVDAKIPNLAESSASPNRPGPWWSKIGVFAIFGLFVRIGGASQSLTWKVHVLEPDYVAAKAALEKT